MAAPSALFLNDQPLPVGTPAISIAETAFSGSLIGQLSATDPDPNETFTFILLDDADGRVFLSGSDLRLSEGATLDGSAAPLSVTVRVSDRTGATLTTTFQIAVTDNPTLITRYDATLADGLFTGQGEAEHFIAGAGNDTFAPDGADIIVFSGNRSDNSFDFTPEDFGGYGGYGGYGSGDPTPAQLLVTDLRSGGPDGQDLILNPSILRFANGDYFLSEILSPGATGLTLDGRHLDTDGHLSESLQPGTIIGQLGMRDAPGIPLIGTTTTFGVRPANVTELNGIFSINGSGQVVLEGALDFERFPEYAFSIFYTDNLGISHFDTLRFLTTDANDFPSVLYISGRSRLAETDAATGEVELGTLDVYDTDGSALGYTFELTGPNAAQFRLDGTTLFVREGTLFDFKTDPFVTLTVSVIDLDIGTPVLLDMRINIDPSRIDGTAASETLEGTDRSEIINARTGDDTILPGLGNDTIYGGGGLDTVTLGVTRASATVTKIASQVYEVATAQGTKTLVQIENIAFSDSTQSLGAQIRGTDRDDSLTGTEGDDFIYAGSGADTIRPGGGSDFVNGAQDYDVIIYDVPRAAAEIGVQAIDAFTVTIAGVIDTLIRVEEIRFTDETILAPLPPGWIMGEPHLLTLDGAAYDFQAVGEFVLLRETGGAGLELQARFIPVPGAPDLSMTGAVAIALGTDTLEISAAAATPLLLNGTATTLADGETLTVGAHIVSRTDNTYVVGHAGADNILDFSDTWMQFALNDGWLDLAVQLSRNLAGSVEGLLGNGDGNPDNDIALANGTPLARPLAFEDLYGQYRDDWRVSTESQSLFTYGAGESLAGFYDPDAPGRAASLADFTAEEIATAAAAATSAGLTPGTLTFDNAVLDFLLTGNPDFFAGAGGDVFTDEGGAAVGNLQEGQTRITFAVDLRDAAGRAISGAEVALLSGNATAPTLALETSAGRYSGSYGSGSTGTFSVSADAADRPAGMAITITDALTALRLSLGLNPSYGTADAFDFIQADIDRSGRVTITDALQILRASLGLATTVDPGWVFVDPNADLSHITATNVKNFEVDPLDLLGDGEALTLLGLLTGNVENAVL
jgi:hypothetical protein